MQFAISQLKMVQLPWNEKQTYQLNSGPQMWPSGLILAMILIFSFLGQIWNLLYLSQTWTDCHEMKFCNNCISGIAGLMDIKQTGWESVIHDHGRDLLVTKMRCKDHLDSDRGDLRCWRVFHSSNLVPSYRIIWWCQTRNAYIHFKHTQVHLCKVDNWMGLLNIRNEGK